MSFPPLVVAFLVVVVIGVILVVVVLCLLSLMRVLALSHASMPPSTRPLVSPRLFLLLPTRPLHLLPPPLVVPSAIIVQKFAGKHIHKANMQAEPALAAMPTATPTRHSSFTLEKKSMNVDWRRQWW